MCFRDVRAGGHGKHMLPIASHTSAYGLESSGVTVLSYLGLESTLHVKGSRRQPWFNAADLPLNNGESRAGG